MTTKVVTRIGLRVWTMRRGGLGGLGDETTDLRGRVQQPLAFSSFCCFLFRQRGSAPVRGVGSEVNSNACGVPTRGRLSALRSGRCGSARDRLPFDRLPFARKTTVRLFALSI